MEHIYQASDLASKRRELMNAARAGLAQIRDTDGTGLVMMPQAHYDLLRAMQQHLAKLVMLEAALDRPKKDRRATDYGELAWLEIFDEDDRQEFRRELLEVLLKALSLESTEPVETCLRDWQTTARALSNERSRKTLTATGAASSFFDEVERPE